MQQRSVPMTYNPWSSVPFKACSLEKKHIASGSAVPPRGSMEKHGLHHQGCCRLSQPPISLSPRSEGICLSRSLSSCQAFCSGSQIHTRLVDLGLNLDVYPSVRRWTWKVELREGGIQQAQTLLLCVHPDFLLKNLCHCFHDKSLLLKQGNAFTLRLIQYTGSQETRQETLNSLKM